jgi:hypothetical protein
MPFAFLGLGLVEIVILAGLGALLLFGALLAIFVIGGKDRKDD